MNLIKRFPYANIYGDDRKQRAVLGGIPNVPIDTKGTLEPLDNEVEIITTNPFAKYVIKRGPFSIGFHDKINNKYGVAIRLRTGETLIKRAIGDSACTPTVIDNRTLQWKYANGSWIREYATEKKVKEIIFQKAGQVIKFKYTVNGFTIKKIGQQIEFYKGNRLAFVLQRPYYCTKDGEFISYVPISWQKIGDDWEITYPAPAQDKYIDPTIVFGEGVGQIGNNKQGAIRPDVGTICYASDEPYLMDGPDAFARLFLLRFDMSSLPTNSIINSGIISIRLNKHTQAGATAFEARQMLHDWGITPTNGGLTENPATAGQATYDHAFDTNGVADVNWTGANYVRGIDSGPILDTAPIGAGDPPGTWYDMDMTTAVAAQVLNDATNYGHILELEQTWRKQVNTLLAANPAHRPYLTVDYTVPVEDEAVRRVLQSHMGLSNPLGIV